LRGPRGCADSEPFPTGRARKPAGALLFAVRSWPGPSKCHERAGSVLGSLQTCKIGASDYVPAFRSYHVSPIEAHRTWPLHVEMTVVLSPFDARSAFLACAATAVWLESVVLALRLILNRSNNGGLSQCQERILSNIVVCSNAQRSPRDRCRQTTCEWLQPSSILCFEEAYQK